MSIPEYSAEKFLKAAEQYYNDGLSVIPLNYSRYKGDDDAKKPAFDIFKNEGWQKYQKERATLDEIRAWFSKPHNVGIVCGSVSGNLTIIDIDDEDTAREFARKLEEAGLTQYLETRMTKTKKGVHMYYKTDGTVKMSVRATEKADIKAEGGYVVAGPSVHPSGVEYKTLVEKPILQVTKQELGRIFEVLGVNKHKIAELLGEQPHRLPTTNTREEMKQLGEEEIQTVVDLLAPYYEAGYRHLLSLYLSGWMAKVRIHPASCAQVIKRLHDAKNDEEPLKNRIVTLSYSYRRTGVDLTKYEGEIESAVGFSISSLERETEEEEVKGITGIYEIIEAKSGKDRADEIIKQLEDITVSLKTIDEFISVMLDEEIGLYMLVDEENMRIIRVKVDRRGRIKAIKETVFKGIPKKVIKYENPLDNEVKYKVKWMRRWRNDPVDIGPVYKNELFERLNANNLVMNERLAKDILAITLSAYEEKGLIEIRKAVDATGFFILENEPPFSIGYEIKNISNEELLAAVEVLNELTTKWYAVDKFATVIRWGLYAPFTYMNKQMKGGMVRWLYLSGFSMTGKTTLGKIMLSLWGLRGTNERGGASVDTVARLGNALSASTFPLLVNEPGGAFMKPEIVEMIKSAIEGTTARSKFQGSTFKDIPSLAPFIFASNKTLPEDDALRRRLIIIQFTYGEKIPDERAKQFEREIMPKLDALSAIGQFVAKRVMNEPSLIITGWEGFSIKMLKEIYSAVGLEVPRWVSEEYAEEKDTREETVTSIRSFFKAKIIEAFARNVPGQERTGMTYGDKVLMVLNGKYIPWIFLKNDKVYFDTSIMREIKERVIDIGSLKSLSELLGWECKKTSIREEEKTSCNVLMSVDFQKFISFLTPEEQEEQNERIDGSQ